MKQFIALTAAFILTFLSLGMSHEKPEAHGHSHEVMPKHGAEEKYALAVIQATAGNNTSGHVLFEKTESGIKVSGKIANLTPGKHGFHVHQYGDLRKADGTSTGGHFAPMGKPHGGPSDSMRHIGDLGNIEADENGVAEFSFVDTKLAFEGSASIIGRGLIVHAGEDDLTSQPTGAAGARAGMAVIGYANLDLVESAAE